MQSLVGHNGPVYSLEVFDNYIFSGSADWTVRVWDRKVEEITVTFIYFRVVNPFTLSLHIKEL